MTTSSGGWAAQQEEVITLHVYRPISARIMGSGTGKVFAFAPIRSGYIERTLYEAIVRSVRNKTMDNAVAAAIESFESTDLQTRYNACLAAADAARLAGRLDVAEVWLNEANGIEASGAQPAEDKAKAVKDAVEGSILQVMFPVIS